MSSGKPFYEHFVREVELDGPDFFKARSEAIRRVASDAQKSDELIQNANYSEWHGEWTRDDVNRGREGIFVSFDGSEDFHTYFFPLRQAK